MGITRLLLPPSSLSISHIGSSICKVRLASSSPINRFILAPTISTSTPLLSHNNSHGGVRCYSAVPLRKPSTPFEETYTNQLQDSPLSNELPNSTLSFQQLHQQYNQPKPQHQIQQIDATDASMHERFSEEEIKKYRMQTEFELGAVDAATNYYKKTMEGVYAAKQGASAGSARQLAEGWYGPLRESIVAATNRMTNLGKEKHKIIRTLMQVDYDKLPVITLHQVMGSILAQPEGVPFLQVAYTVGKAIQAEINYDKIKKEDPKAFKSMLKTKTGVSVALVNAKARFILKQQDLDTKTVIQVGSFLIKHLLSSALVEKNIDKASSRPHGVPEPKLSTRIRNMMRSTRDKEPAFLHDYRYYKQGTVTRRQGYIKCHDNVLQLINEGHIVRELNRTRLMPMVVPPVPWVSPSIGTYLYVPTFLMRTHGHRAQSSSLWTADLSTVYKALNALGSTPWVINEKVYKVVMECWEGGGGLADIPSRADIPYPEPPSDIHTNRESMKSFRRTEKKIKQLNADLHSLRCDLLYKLDQAANLLHVPFYLPHNLDFRGRAYPIPPHLNQLGSDMCRGLLLFEEAKPLGPHGLFWVKVHLANLYGVDKVPFADRVAFTEKHMEQIRDSAERPMAGNRWWTKADDPWQCLSVCFELVEALKCKDPATYKTRLPVHQDGSCNGLQHYAALGGDPEGGAKVNLLPSDSPQDVYSGISTLVAKKVADDAANGVEMGVLLAGKIDRKIVKQTVMTSVYGVTYVGARQQIYNALSDKNIEWANDDQLYAASAYITHHTFESLNQMFLGARNTMKWLADCARTIAKKNEPVAWVTPLGLPVVQPYVKGGNMTIKTVVQSVTLADPSGADLPVNTMKQRSAFPPNYVHSLDSSHMMLTAIECQKQGITYASVHDSYWTHPSSVEEMSTILREQFVFLHNQPLLPRLREWFQKRYGPEEAFPPPPERGPLDLHQVLKSPYFFH